MINIILISGKAGHGKTTFANFIKSEFESRGKKVMKIAFADYLKYIASEYYGWNGEKDERGRTLLQHLGTDVVRKNDENFWADLVSRLIRALGDEFDYYIIDDARFPNEIEAFPLENSIHIQIERPSITESFLTDEQQHHLSETALEGYVPDYILLNHTFEGLKESAQTLVEEINNEH